LCAPKNLCLEKLSHLKVLDQGFILPAQMLIVRLRLLQLPVQVRQHQIQSLNLIVVAQTLHVLLLQMPVNLVVLVLEEHKLFQLFFGGPSWRILFIKRRIVP